MANIQQVARIGVSKLRVSESFGMWQVNNITTAKRLAKTREGKFGTVFVNVIMHNDQPREADNLVVILARR